MLWEVMNYTPWVLVVVIVAITIPSPAPLGAAAEHRSAGVVRAEAKMQARS